MGTQVDFFGSSRRGKGAIFPFEWASRQSGGILLLFFLFLFFLFFRHGFFSPRVGAIKKHASLSPRYEWVGWTLQYKHKTKEPTLFLYLFVATRNLMYDNHSLQWACARGYLAMVQWVLQHNPKVCISANNDAAFRAACANGHLSVAQWLFAAKPKLNISAKKDEAFCTACANGHLEVAQWLLSVKTDIDISAQDEFALCHACAKHHLAVAQWLLTVRQHTTWTLTSRQFQFFVAPLFANTSAEKEAWADVATHILSQNPDWDWDRAQAMGLLNYVMK